MNEFSARDPRNIRGYRRLSMGEEGQAMLEFIFTFPYVFLMALAVLQLALMYAAQNVVDYAAFCAARSASVYVGRHQAIPFDSSAPYEIDNGKRYGKIHLAAAFPLTVISPSLTQVGGRLPIVGPGAAFVGQLIGLLPASLQGIIRQVDKFAYAYAATSIIPGEAGISVWTDAGGENWGNATLNYDPLNPIDRGDLYVKVSYIKFLEIPFINYFIAQYWPRVYGYPINRATAAYGDRENNFWPIAGFCRVPNEGAHYNQDEEPNLWLDVWGIF